MRFAFEKNIFHTSESTQSNPTEQRMQTIMVRFVESVKSILEIANSLCLIQICILCLTAVAQARPIFKYFSRAPLNPQAKEMAISKEGNGTGNGMGSGNGKVIQYIK